MNIRLSSFSYYEVSFFNGGILPSFTAQQKKIILIASFAFGLLAASWYIANWYFKSKKVEKPKERSENEPPIKSESLNKQEAAINQTEDETLSNEVAALDESQDDQREASSPDKEKKDLHPIFMKTAVEDGQGKKTYPDGSVEEGEFKNDKLEGKGKRTLKGGILYAGDVFEGEFKGGLLNSQGKRTFYDQIWEGEFKDNNFQRGKITYPGGTVAKGEFTDHTLLPGDFKGCKLNGRGHLTWKNGEEVWEGEFKDHRLNGPGKRTFSDGRVEEGVFYNGDLIIPKK